MAQGRNNLPVVVLVSGNGSNLQAIIDATRRDALPVQILAVISNRPDAYALERARAAGIEALTLDHRGFPDRTHFDSALQALIDARAPQLVVLAGFMRVLSDAFVAHYRGRMVNIHPSLLPALRGLDTHRRALAAGLRVHGASVHLVSEELDGGAVIAQVRVPVEPHDDASTLAARVLAQEHRLYPTVLRWWAEGRLRYVNAGLLLDGQPLDTPVLLEARGAAP